VESGSITKNFSGKKGGEEGNPRLAPFPLATARPAGWLRQSLVSLILTLVLSSVNLWDAAALPPSEISSPDRVYSVQILHTALPGSDSYIGFYTITVSRLGTVFSKYATEGYLLEAFWATDGKFVAVNNRRSNSGDYLWIFRLSDGKALRVPNDDEAPSFVSRVQAKFHELSNKSFNRRYTLARGWETSRQLRVRTNLEFFNLDQAEIQIDQVCSIEGEKLSVVKETITKVLTEEGK
jgi:hypothetical protein